MAECAALSLAIISFFCGGKLINYDASHKLRSLGTMFVVLSFVLVVVLIVGNYLDLGGMQYKGTMVACIMLSIAFLIFDTQLIIDGRYIDITVDDYVFMSMKLFADVVLIFSLILKFLQ